MSYSSVALEHGEWLKASVVLSGHCGRPDPGPVSDGREGGPEAARLHSRHLVQCGSPGGLVTATAVEID